MKKLQVIFISIVLCGIIVIFFNCSKDEDQPLPPLFNYAQFTDARDGKTYKSIKIGNQEWMAENLAFKTESGSWNPGGITDNFNKYGYLYTWEAAKQAVPNGWHLPTDEEWKELEIFLGMSQSDADEINYRGTNEGDKLKSLTGWSENGNGTDNVGFTALPAGLRTNSGSFFVYTWYSYWWTATESDNSNAWFRLIVHYRSKIGRNQSFKEDAYSVRCVKD
ncbi:MAG TPA: fibrobacter succinogenes major paralogous domain-containing protein [Prolixibacteraceae bacterium]